MPGLEPGDCAEQRRNEFKGHIIALLDKAERVDRLLHDFLADAIPGEHGNFVVVHRCFFRLIARHLVPL